MKNFILFLSLIVLSSCSGVRVTNNPHPANFNERKVASNSPVVGQRDFTCYLQADMDRENRHIFKISDRNRTGFVYSNKEKKILISGSFLNDNHKDENILLINSITWGDRYISVMTSNSGVLANYREEYNPPYGLVRWFEASMNSATCENLVIEEPNTTWCTKAKSFSFKIDCILE